MSLRALLPWLLVGALLASSYANLVMYRNSRAPEKHRHPPPGVGRSPGDSVHHAPDSSGGRCPTLDLLELSPDQRSRIRQCSLTSLDLRTDLAVEIDAASVELEQLLSIDSIDGARVLELADLISDFRSRQYKAWIGSILVVRDVLTPEQLRLLHELESN